MEIKLSVLFRTTFLPTGATYYGVHDTADLSFGTDQYRDPFIGNGTKLVAIAKQHGNQRRLFRVDVVQVGTRKEVDTRLKTILDGLDYTSSKTLNSVEGNRTPTHTPEHNAKVGKANETAALGLVNALKIDIDAPANTKLKWFNNGTESKMLLCDAEDNPIKEEYKDWKLGKGHKNPYVQKKLDEAKATANTAPTPSEEDSEDDSEE